MGPVQFLSHSRFHRSITVPPNPDTGRSKPLRVTYADYGDPTSNAVVLFCGPLFGTRFSYSPLDGLAKVHRVRIIHPNRPGVGGSDPVELHQRIQTWLEIVPFLLRHLNISQISIVSHSGGLIYALNTILTYPDLFHPTTPYASFFAPWVHQSHTGVSHLKATELLPAALIGKFANVAKFMNNSVIPLAGYSTTVFRSIKGSFAGSTAAVGCSTWTLYTPSVRPPSVTLPDEDIFGLDMTDAREVEELKQLLLTYMFAETIDGVSADAQLFLKKPSTVAWSLPPNLWSDLDEFVPLLLRRTAEANLQAIESGTGGSRQWIVDAFHAQTDDMVGTKGTAWFDQCWQPALESTEIEYNHWTVMNADHNNVFDPTLGAVEKWMVRVRQSFPEVEEIPEIQHLEPPHGKHRKKTAHLTLLQRVKRFTYRFRSPSSQISSEETPIVVVDDWEEMNRGRKRHRRWDDA